MRSFDAASYKSSEPTLASFNVVKAVGQPTRHVLADATRWISQDEAMSMVERLPETALWSNRIEQASGGLVQAALMAFPGPPETFNNQMYWLVDLYEDEPERYRPWRTFWVRVDGAEILVETFQAEAPISLVDWRMTEEGRNS
jgi:hypothetical protein